MFDPFITGEDSYNRVVSASLEVPAESMSITVYDAGDAEFKYQTLEYTVAQYQGLAAIQHAIDEKYRLMLNLPPLEFDGEDNSLNVASSQANIYVCVDGKKIITTIVEDKIKALTLSETGPAADERFVNITWEDAQKLIGLPIY